MQRFSAQVDYWFCFFLALMLLVVPLDWLVSAFAAALVHELFHILAVYAMGEKIVRFQIGISGAVLQTTPISPGRTLAASLAGPFGSLLLLNLIHLYPKIAICGGLQGLFNLLPIYPLDGGRALHSVLSLFLSEKRASKTIEIVQWTAVAVLGILCIFLSIWLRTGIALLFIMGMVKILPRKISCKP